MPEPPSIRSSPPNGCRTSSPPAPVRGSGPLPPLKMSGPAAPANTCPADGGDTGGGETGGGETGGGETGGGETGGGDTGGGVLTSKKSVTLEPTFACLPAGGTVLLTMAPVRSFAVGSGVAVRPTLSRSAAAAS